MIHIVLLLLLFLSPSLADNAVQQWETDKKTAVYFQPTPGLPMFDVALVVKAGSRSTTPGLAQLTVASVGLGSKFLNREQISAKLDQYGSEFNAYTSRDAIVFHLRTLSNTPVDQVVSIFKESLFYSAFPNHEVREQIKKTYHQLAVSQLNPKVIGEEAMMRALFPSAPFFYSPINGYADTLVNLSSTDLAHFHSKMLNPENTKIIILGDIDSDKASTIATQISDGMIASASLSTPETLSAKNDAQTISIKPDQPQTFFTFSTKLPVSLTNDQYAAWLVINELLGANSSSLLFQALRDNTPLVYSIHSKLKPIDDFALLSVSGESDKNEISKVDKIFNDLITNLKEHFVSDKQFAIAKKSLINKLLLSNTNNSEQLDQLVYLTTHNLSPGDHEKLIASIRSLSILDAKKALAQLNTKQFYRVYVGH